MKKNRVAFIGAVGLPNRYGGFEAFLEHCAPEIARMGHQVLVTCDASVYPDGKPIYEGVGRVFVSIRANGPQSIIHDFIAFWKVFFRTDCIFVLGVSGGIWFPLFRLASSIFGKRLIVNVDGVEWKRSKFSAFRRFVLRSFDALAQRFSHVVIYDNEALRPFLLSSSGCKSVMVPYSGDHVLRLSGVEKRVGTALTICRIEPENNIEMLLDGFLKSDLAEYVFVGNWDSSEYGRSLRDAYKSQPRLKLLDPVYDSVKLASFREECEFYIHGHSVGGTNPSLVEMLFYDAKVLCFDVPFHHETAGDHVDFFCNADVLGHLLSDSSGKNCRLKDRGELRARYTKEQIAIQYLNSAHI